MDLIIIVIVGLILGLAGGYIYREKKNGSGCIGCPDSKTCASKGGCAGCSGGCKCK